MSLITKDQEIAEEFEFFEDWMEKYNHIIDLGKNLKNFDASLKSNENLVSDLAYRFG
ncbi:MAG: SufE family protein [Saprospiraceae bacterium]